MKKLKQQVYEQLVEKTKEITGIDVSLTRRRTREIVQCKSAIIKVMIDYYHMSLSEIARLFGMHHATIIHHRDDHPYRYMYEHDYAVLYDQLVKHCLEQEPEFRPSEIISMMKVW